MSDTGSLGAHGAELSSVASALEELTRRVTAIADEYASVEREDLSAELYAAERDLVAARRRLGRAADALRGGQAR